MPDRPPVQPDTERAPLSPAAPLVLAVALFMEQMDSTVIATSLPAIAADIGTSPVALKLALTAYLVSLAIFIPISGWMAERYGARRVFRIAIAVFVVGSVACAFAGSLGAFVAARFLQGMGGAMMTPVARLVLVRSTPKSELVQAMAWLTIPALIGPLIGPPVGGFITTFLTWHWIFLINAPIGLAGIYMAGRVLPDIPPLGDAKLDRKGFVLSGAAASGIVFGLSVVSLPALPPWVGVTTVIAGAICAVLYVRHARRTPSPVLQLNLFANPVFRAAIVGGSLFRIGAGAVPFLLPLYFQLGFGMTPFQSGMLTFASAGGAILLKFMAPAALRIGGFRNVLTASAVAGAAFIAINAAFTAATPWPVIIAVLFASGFLRSLFFTSVNALVFAEVSEAEAAQATGLAAASQQISIALGVAVAGGALEAISVLTGEGLTTHAFVIAFLVVAALTSLAAIPFAFLHPDAGSSVSGKAPVARSTSPITPPG